jgi:carboxymethylenebutenolidase
MEIRTEATALGHLAFPASGTHPGVVMIHDVWGLGPLYRDFADRLAGHGFATLAIDLYRRPVEIADPGRWMRDLSDPDVLADVQAAVHTLAGHSAVEGKPVGVTGFCMGGTYALLAAANVRRLAACVAFYGLLSHEHGLLAAPDLDRKKHPRDPLRAASDIACPTLGIFGDQDPFVPVSDVHALGDVFATVPHDTEIKLYPGCGHAFLNEGRLEAYRPDAARDAWDRMVGWFHRHLGS